MTGPRPRTALTDVYEEQYGTPSGRSVLEAAFEEFAGSLGASDASLLGGGGDDVAILSAPIGFRGLFCLRTRDGGEGEGEGEAETPAVPVGDGDPGSLERDQAGKGMQADYRGRLDSGDEMVAERSKPPPGCVVADHEAPPSGSPPGTKEAGGN